MQIEADDDSATESEHEASSPRPRLNRKRQDPSTQSPSTIEPESLSEARTKPELEITELNRIQTQ